MRATFRPYFGVAVFIFTHAVVAESERRTERGKSEVKHNSYRARSKTKVEKGIPWPFLPSPGFHHGTFPGYPSYPFLIVAPPNLEAESEEKLKDEKGSKYYEASRRQTVALPQTSITASYVPVYYVMPQYLTDQSSYTNYYYNGYQPYQEIAAVNQPYLQYTQTYGSVQPYPLKPYFFFKRSNATKAHITQHSKLKSAKRQVVPHHHWSFSQWPYDSHEYAFTPDPSHSSDVPHLPRWGPLEWGGTGPGRHWAMNREGLPSPFGIGLAPHMGGQGYVGFGGHWPGGHGYPLPTNFPKPPYLQHHLP